MRWLETLTSLALISLAGYAVWFYANTGDLPLGLGDVLESSTRTRSQGPSPQAVVNLSESVVEVRAVGLFGYVTVGRGAGVIVEADGGWRILTASHVLATDLVKVRRQGRTQWVAVEVVTQDPDRDIAVLQTIGVSELPAVTVPPLASELPSEGDPVFLVCSRGEEIRRGLFIDTVTRVGGALNMFTTVPSEPGCSGGPMVNRRGELLGIAIQGSEDSTLGVAVDGDLFASFQDQ